MVKMKLQAELCKLEPQASEDATKMGSGDEMGGDDDSETGGGDEMGRNDEMGGNGEEDPDILDDGNWSFGEYSGGEIEYM